MWTEDITVSGNVIKNINGSGIFIGTLGALTKSITVSGNTLTNTNRGNNASPQGAAIGIRSATDCLVTGNKITGSTHTHIVEETGSSDNNDIIGNKGDAGTIATISIVGASSVVSESNNYQGTGLGVIDHETVTITNEGTYTFRSRGVTNRALYLIATNFSDQTQGVFSLDGTSAPVNLVGGTAIAYGSINPDTVGAVNIWPASSSTISIKNRLGSDREFTLMSLGTT